jgi:hypothetical protein
MKKEEKIIKTENFYLSAYLIAKGCELSGIEPSNSEDNRFTFCFFNSERLQRLKGEFLSLRAMVSPQDFANAQKNLRSIIYAEKNNAKPKTGKRPHMSLQLR